MRRVIHGERAGIYIIDLLKTASLLAAAQEFVDTLAHRGGTVLFVGTKKQARDTIREVAQNAGMPYVNHRWLGGLLTNFQTINLRIRRLHDLERYEAEGQLELLPTRERMSAQAAKPRNRPHARPRNKPRAKPRRPPRHRPPRRLRLRERSRPSLPPRPLRPQQRSPRPPRPSRPPSNRPPRSQSNRPPPRPRRRRARSRRRRRSPSNRPHQSRRERSPRRRRPRTRLPRRPPRRRQRR